MSSTNHKLSSNNNKPNKLQKLPIIVSIAFVASAYLILILFHNTEEIKTLSVVFCSIMLEAAPFMLIGSLIGGLIETFISREKLLSIVPKGQISPILIAAGLGMVLPVCECAIVPVVRRLCRKGMPAPAAIAYLLGGPAVNPIVAASTALAYRFDWRVAALRIVLGYLIAVAVSLFIQRILNSKKLLLENIEDDDNHTNCSCGHNHHKIPITHLEHHGSDCSCEHEHTNKPSKIFSKITQCINHASDDFFSAGHYLVIGAFLAALAQTFVSRDFFTSFSTFTLLPSIMMICLAILLNLCSETDAFIAASMRGLLPLSAQMAFMLTGPIFDLKLLLMYQRIFRKRTIILLAISILLSVFCICAGIELFERYI